nr:MAG TPA: hypothetical protein [Caudoviricetes sp.]
MITMLICFKTASPLYRLCGMVCTCCNFPQPLLYFNYRHRHAE